MRSRLLEREHELATTSHLLDAAALGSGGVVVVEGPAGIGKTSLLRASRESALDRGFRVLAASGGPLTEHASFSVLRELFGPVLRDGDRADDGLSPAARLALPALGLADTLADASPDARAAAVHGLSWLALELARERPLLLVLDDLHAADEDSLHWLAALARQLPGAPVAAVLAVRPGTRLAASPGLAPGPDVRWLRPDALGVAAVEKLLLDRGLDRSLAESVHGATGGVPFLVDSMIHALGGADVTWPVDDELLRGVAAATSGPGIVATLAAQVTHGLDVAQAAWILGPDAEQRRVATLAGLPRDEIGRVGDQLAAEGVTEEGWPLRFRHALVSDAVGASIPAGARSRLHGQAADLLAREGAAPDRVATHLLLTEPAGSPATAELLRTVASAELDRGAALSSVGLLRRALREPPSAGQIADVLLALGRAEAKADLPEAVDRLAEAAARGQEPRWRSEVHEARGWALLAGGRAVEALEAYEQALAELPPADAGRRLELHAEHLAIAQMEVATADEVDALAARVEALVRTSGRPTIAPRAWGALAHRNMARGDSSKQARRLAHRALAGVAHSPGRLLESPAFMLARDALIASDDLAVPGDLAARAEEWAVNHGAQTLLIGARWTLARVAWQQGDLRRVDEITGAVLQAADAGLVGFVQATVMLPLRVQGLVALGRIDEAGALLDTYGLQELPREMVPFSALLWARAAYWLATSQADRAVEELLAAGDRLIAAGIVNPAASDWRSQAGLALVRSGDRTQGLPLVDEEVRLSTAYGSARAQGIALHRRALAGDDDAVEETLAEACRVLAAGPDRAAYGEALVDLGALKRRRGRRRDARELLVQGRNLALACGAAALADRSAAELLASGTRIAERPIRGAAALTASERRVAVLAAGGASNAEIGQHLFISLKTVEMHLSRAYRKLGVRRRRELTAALDEAQG